MQKKSLRDTFLQIKPNLINPNLWSVRVTACLPAGDFSCRGGQALAGSTELAFVQVAQKSDVLTGALAEFGSVCSLQAGPTVMAEAFTFS